MWASCLVLYSISSCGQLTKFEPNCQKMCMHISETHWFCCPLPAWHLPGGTLSCDNENTPVDGGSGLASGWGCYYQFLVCHSWDKGEGDSQISEANDTVNKSWEGNSKLKRSEESWRKVFINLYWIYNGGEEQWASTVELESGYYLSGPLWCHNAHQIWMTMTRENWKT